MMTDSLSIDVAADSMWLLRFNALDEDGSAELDFEEFKQIMDTCVHTQLSVRVLT